ncbi:MAG: hypothetical protein KAT70_09570, partial [Thermoplasmata archaeon]|nr:hypothetical protein [Thermoplasmata archaeon]
PILHSMCPTPLVYSQRFATLDFGPGHPFRGKRFSRFMRIARETGFLNHVELVEPDVATTEELLTAHDHGYLERVMELAKEEKPLSPDTPLTQGSPLAAKRIVGGVLKTGELALERGAALGFGGMHHAYRSKGGGFCLYNDVAILIEWLKERGYERILNMDTDAHCGDGTMDMFYEDREVLYISLHQHPDTLYPGTGRVNQVGRGKGEGYTLNLPMPPDSMTEEYRKAFERIVRPVVEEFSPQVIIRNGGSDPSGWDLLTSLDMNMEGLSFLGQMGRELAQASGAPLIDLLLSGYGGGIAEGWLALWRGTLGIDMNIEFDYISDQSPAERIEAAKDLEKMLD